MYNIYEEKVNYNDYVLDIEIFYSKKLENIIYLGHSFFVLKENKVLEEYPENISVYVDNIVKDLCKKIN